MESPSNAIQAGIGMVHQHFMLVPVFTVTENVMLGVEPVRNGVFLDRPQVAAHIREISDQYSLDLDPDAYVKDLSVGVQQRVEIVKTLYRKADILIFDEPTAVLTPRRWSEFFKILRSLVDRGRLGHLHHPQAEGGHGHRRPHHRAAQWPRGGHGDARQDERRPSWRA